jgi:hypothetical protein
VLSHDDLCSQRKRHTNDSVTRTRLCVRIPPGTGSVRSLGPRPTGRHSTVKDVIIYAPRNFYKHATLPLLTFLYTMTVKGAPSSLVSSFFTLLFGLAGAWFAFKILQALYHVSPFHPLSRIPGPRLAAATYLPEFYYDVVKFGCYTKEIARMHETYGE